MVNAVEQEKGELNPLQVYEASQSRVVDLKQRAKGKLLVGTLGLKYGLQRLLVNPL
jgi:hypothetical protein